VPCGCESMPLFSFVFCLSRAVHKFEFRLVSVAVVLELKIHLAEMLLCLVGVSQCRYFLLYFVSLELRISLNLDLSCQ
jgi:hypothetical protein